MDKNKEHTRTNSIYFPFYLSWVRERGYLKMVREMGGDGSRIFIELLVYLAEKEPRQESIDAIPDISDLIRMDVEKVAQVIQDFELFEIKEGSFYCPLLNQSLEKLDETRRKQREGGKMGADRRYKRGNIQESDSLPIGDLPENDGLPIAVKESKVEYSKENETKEDSLIKGNEVFLEERSLEQFGEEFNRILFSNSRFREYFNKDNCKRFIEYVSNISQYTNKPYYASRNYDIKKQMSKWIEKG